MRIEVLGSCVLSAVALPGFTILRSLYGSSHTEIKFLIHAACGLVSLYILYCSVWCPFEHLSAKHLPNLVTKI